MTSQYKTNLWSTHVNIVRLAEPIRHCVRWRTHVFKVEQFVCKRFLPSPPPLSFFGSRFISSSVKTENSLPRSFFAPKPNGNACYAGYAQSDHSNTLHASNCLTDSYQLFHERSRYLSGFLRRQSNSIPWCIFLEVSRNISVMADSIVK